MTVILTIAATIGPALKQHLPDLYPVERMKLGEAIAEALAATPTPPTLSEDLREAAQAVIEQAFDFYKARNGRVMSIEGEDGEKCWIVPFDAFETLRAALARAQVKP